MHPDAASDKHCLGWRGATLLLGWIAATVLCVVSFRSLFWFKDPHGLSSNWLEYSHLAAAIFLLLFSGWLLLVRYTTKGSPDGSRWFGVPEAVLLGVSIAPVGLPLAFMRNWGNATASLELDLTGHYAGPNLPGPGGYPEILLWVVGLYLAPVPYLIYLRSRGLCAPLWRVIASFFLFYASLPIADEFSSYVLPFPSTTYTVIRSALMVPFMYAALAVMVGLRG